MKRATRTIWLVAAGGATGTTARYELLLARPTHAGTFPTTTLFINLVGAFLLGALLEALAKNELRSQWARPLLGIGVLGAFTTFSSIASETALLVRGGRPLVGASYVAATLLLGVVAAAAGLIAGGWRPFQPVPDVGES